MIDDGYTFTENGVHFRPLMDQQKREVDSAFRERNWDFLKRMFPGSDDDVRCRIFRRSMDWDDAADMKNLRDSVHILLTKPLLGIRSCDVCKAWWFDEDTGKILLRGNKPARRPGYAKPLCESESQNKCLKGHYSNPIELNERNRICWQRFCEYRNTGLPDEWRQCPIVRATWRIMGELVEQHGFPELCHRLHG